MASISSVRPSLRIFSYSCSFSWRAVCKSAQFWLSFLIRVTALIRSNLPLLLISAVACTPVVPWAGRRLYDAGAEHGWAWALYRAVIVVAPVALLLLATMTLVGDSYNPFLYWKF